MKRLGLALLGVGVRAQTLAITRIYRHRAYKCHGISFLERKLPVAPGICHKYRQMAVGMGYSKNELVY